MYIMIFFYFFSTSFFIFFLFYFPFFILNIMALGITGHYGGSLTHGSNYLFEKETSKLIQVEDVDQLMVYEDIIQQGLI